jgi:hypothetical protein
VCNAVRDAVYILDRAGNSVESGSNTEEKVEGGTMGAGNESLNSKQHRRRRSNQKPAKTGLIF